MFKALFCYCVCKSWSNLHTKLFMQEETCNWFFPIAYQQWILPSLQLELPDLTKNHHALCVVHHVGKLVTWKVHIFLEKNPLRDTTARAWRMLYHTDSVLNMILCYHTRPISTYSHSTQKGKNDQTWLIYWQLKEEDARIWWRSEAAWILAAAARYSNALEPLTAAEANNSTIMFAHWYGKRSL